MKSLPTQARAIRKRRALIDEAITQFSQRVFEEVTAKSIAAGAQVATGTFYQYFDDKHEVLRIIAKERVALLVERIGNYELKPVSPFESYGVESVFLETMNFVYDFHMQNPELHQVLEQRRVVDGELHSILLEGEQVLQQRVIRFVEPLTKSEAISVGKNLFAMSEGLVHDLVFGGRDDDHQKGLALGATMLASFFDQS